MIIIYVTHKNEEAAQKIIDHLLEKKLIACANTLPIQSCYWWKGTKEKDHEIVTLLKTRDSLWNAITQEIKRVHPYEVPCILKIEIEANSEYESWVENETRENS